MLPPYRLLIVTESVTKSQFLCFIWEIRVKLNVKKSERDQIQ